MDDQLDNDLKNRIKEVFEHIEDPSANEGWLLLRDKFPEERAVRRPFAWIWWGAAAVLLLFFGIGLWVKSARETPKNNIVKTVKYSQRENLAIKKVPKDSIDEIATNQSNTTAPGVDCIVGTRIPSRGVCRRSIIQNGMTAIGVRTNFN